jgi:transcriptional regulator with XRE-family HTH domain
MAHPNGLNITILAQRLATARQAVGLTQTEVADRAGLNLGNYNELERAQRTGLRADTLIRLSQVLGVSLDYLAGLTDDPQPRPRARRRSPRTSDSPTENAA